jgi:hypothetical protein
VVFSLRNLNSPFDNENGVVIRAVINNKSIHAEMLNIIRYGVEINDPWIAELVRRVDAGETITDNLNTPPTSEEKI